MFIFLYTRFKVFTYSFYSWHAVIRGGQNGCEIFPRASWNPCTLTAWPHGSSWLCSFQIQPVLSSLVFRLCSHLSQWMGQLNSGCIDSLDWGLSGKEAEVRERRYRALWRLWSPHLWMGTLASLQNQTAQDLKWFQGWKDIAKTDHTVTDVKDLAALSKPRDKPKTSPQGGWLREYHNANYSQEVSWEVAP